MLLNKGLGFKWGLVFFSNVGIFVLQSEPRIHENTITQGDILLLKDVEAAEKEFSASPEQDQSLIEDNEVVSQRRSKRSKTSSKERSSSSDSQALAALLIEEPLNSLQLAVTGVEQTDMVMKEKKLDKRSSATRKSLSRRVKRLAPQGDIAAFLKPPTSQEESIASPENEIEDLSRDEQRASKVVQSLEKYLSQFIDTSYCTKTSLVLNWPLYFFNLEEICLCTGASLLSWFSVQMWIGILSGDTCLYHDN